MSVCAIMWAKPIQRSATILLFIKYIHNLYLQITSSDFFEQNIFRI